MGIKCIEEFASNIKIEDILSLVKLYYGMQIEEVQRDYIAAVFSKLMCWIHTMTIYYR